jgi:hypothetical protein
MPDIVKFSKGNSGNLPSPSSDSVGTFLFEEDTGNAYINVSSTSQVQIKDDTKVPLEGNSTVNGNITLSGNHILTAPVVDAAVIHGQSLAIDTIEPDTANKLVLTGGTSNTVEVGSDLQVDGDISGTLSNALTIGSKNYDNSSPTSVELSDLGTFTATANTLSSGSQATVSVTGTQFTFGIPRGNTGEEGPQGPQGPQGNPGQDGEDGGYWIPSVSTSGLISWTASKSGMGTAPTSRNIMGPQGDPGQDGQDGLTTSINFGGTTYTQSSGTITIPTSAFLNQARADNRYAQRSSEWTIGYLVGINAAGQLFGSIPVVRTLTLSNTDDESPITVTIPTSYTSLSSPTITIPARGSVTIPILSKSGSFTMTMSGTAELSSSGPYGVSRSGSTYTITDYVGTILMNHPCLTGDTLITMADGSIKRLDEIVLGDEVLHFDFSTKSLVPCKVIRLDDEDYRVSDQYDKFIFSDGTEIKAVNSHYFYNYDHKHMVDIFQWDIGDRAYSQNGELISLVSRETVNETVRYYNIVVDSGPVYGTNYFANGLMSGDCANLDPYNTPTYFEELDVF